MTIEIDGHDVPGRATVHVGDDPDAVGALTTYLEHRPRAARAFELATGGTFDRSALVEAAKRVVSVRIDLQPSTT